MNDKQGKQYDSMENWDLLKKIFIIFFLFSMQVFPENCEVTPLSKTQSFLQTVKSYGKSMYATVLPIISSFWENYQESTWQLTALKICFDYWLFKSYIRPFFVSTAILTEEYFNASVYCLDKNSTGAGLIRSIFDGDILNHIFVVETADSTCATSENIYLEKKFIDYLHSFDEKKQYQALAAIAHEQRHIDYRHAERFGRARKMMQIMTTVSLRKIYFSLNNGELHMTNQNSNVLFSKAEQEDNAVTNQGNVRQHSGSSIKSLGIAGTVIISIELLKYFVPSMRAAFNGMFEGIDGIISLLGNYTFGRYCENDADAITHEDPVVLYKILRGSKDYFQSQWDTWHPLAKKLSRVFSFVDAHAPHPDRIKVAESRMQALYDQYESVRNIVDNEKN